jgi:hypothetical protein
MELIPPPHIFGTSENSEAPLPHSFPNIHHTELTLTLFKKKIKKRGISELLLS